MKSNNRKKIVIKSIFIVIILFMAYTFCWSQSVKNYQNSGWVFSGGGGSRSSANYQQFDVFGEAVAGLRTSSNYEENDGFIYQIMESIPSDTIDVSINDTSSSPGDVFMYPIYVSDTNVNPQVESFEFTLSYTNSTILTATDYDTDETLTSGPDWMIVKDTLTSGEITITAASTSYLSGQGVLLNIVFEVSSTAQIGQTSELEISEFTFNEGAPIADLSSASAIFTVDDGDNYDVSGNISYYSTFEPVPDVTVFLDASKDSTTTNSNGDYLFSNIPGGNYTISPVKDAICSNGINAIDYGKIKRHILGLETIPNSSHKWMAADVNGDEYINAIDYGKIKQCIIGSINTFPVGNWLFDPEDIAIELNNNISDQDFIGIKVGDVNGDWSPSGKGYWENNNSSLSNNIDSSKLSIFTKNNLFCINEAIDISILAENFRGSSVELHLSYDDSKLNYKSYKSKYLNDSDVQVVDNKINIFKDFTKAKNITDILISLTFVADKPGETKLNFNDCLTLDEFYNPDYDVAYEDGLLSVEEFDYEFDKTGFDIFTKPNPIKYSTSIIYYLPQSSNIKIRIYNIRGELVKTLINGYQTNGVHSLKWNTSYYKNGIYFCNISSGRYSNTKKMIIAK